MTSYSSRETRRERLAMLIAENFKKGDVFCVWDIHALWGERWDYCPTQKELSKILPIFGLEFEKHSGSSAKYYICDGRSAKELYQRRSRTDFGYDMPSDKKYQKEEDKEV